jgi:hypothetical protein
MVWNESGHSAISMEAMMWLSVTMREPSLLRWALFLWNYEMRKETDCPFHFKISLEEKSPLFLWTIQEKLFGPSTRKSRQRMSKSPWKRISRTANDWYCLSKIWARVSFTLRVSFTVLMEGEPFCSTPQGSWWH